jgi:hypothetical protein
MRQTANELNLDKGFTKEMLLKSEVVFRNIIRKAQTQTELQELPLANAMKSYLRKNREELIKLIISKDDTSGEITARSESAFIHRAIKVVKSHILKMLQGLDIIIFTKFQAP